MQREILDYMDTRIATDQDPHRFSKPLRHELRGYGAIVFLIAGLFATSGSKPAWCLF